MAQRTESSWAQQLVRRRVVTRALRMVPQKEQAYLVGAKLATEKAGWKEGEAASLVCPMAAVEGWPEAAQMEVGEVLRWGPQKETRWARQTVPQMERTWAQTMVPLLAQPMAEQLSQPMAQPTVKQTVPRLARRMAWPSAQPMVPLSVLR